MEVVRSVSSVKALASEIRWAATQERAVWFSDDE
jgi:hypothetical protein